MLELTPRGLYCRSGNFYIDPSRGVENAIVTHAHSDHARRGSTQYFSVTSGESLLRARLGKSIRIKTYAYGEPFQMGDVTVSLHPAGHILGSSQVRLEGPSGEVWVVSGDYKRDPDPTCEPFEVVPCDVFVTEATFGTPAYAWDKSADLGREIAEWWKSNAVKGRNSVLFAYSLGKTQRVLGVLKPYAEKPILCAPSSHEINECYRRQGVEIASTRSLNEISSHDRLHGELLLVPPSFLQSEQAVLLAEDYETAFASGWMAQKSGPRGRGYDRGFVMSDHADWNDLVRTVMETGAKRVYVQHRGAGALVRHLKSIGLQAYPEAALILHDGDQLPLF